MSWDPPSGAIDQMQNISLVITDLDNTLYDWVTFFARAFYAMVDVAVELLEVDREILLDELREVHIRHHNSEQPFALLETRTVERKLQGKSRHDRYAFLDPAFHAFNKVRTAELRLYPGVEETLRAIVARGCPVVAHTEASIANAVFRLKKLGVLPHIERIYALEDVGQGHPDPQRESLIQDVAGRIRLLRPDERKPDPRVILDICKDARVSLDRTLYVGDSIPRDIGMARSVGAWAAWARYGTQYDRELWQKLVRITHWTQADVLSAQRAQETYGHVKPDVTLDSFDHLLSEFEFFPN